jgi:hypothetical protein
MDESGVLRISCDECVMQATAACDDCVVTFLCERDVDGVAVIDRAEAGALQTLARAGLAPVLRHRRRVQA